MDVKSLRSHLKFSSRLGTPYILYMKDVMEKDGIVHLPLYMAPFLCEKG